MVFLSSYAIAPQINLPQTLKVPFFNKEINTFAGNFPLKLGLDLQGGTQLVLETKMDKIDLADRDNALESAKDVIERRVNLFGVSESVIQTSKVGDSRRILVDLPGIKNASEAANLVGKTAQLEFRELPASPSADSTASGALEVFNAVPTGLTGKDLKRAKADPSNDPQNPGYVVGLQFNEEGAKKFEEITRNNLSKPLAMFLDEEPISWPPPVVQAIIPDGNAQITGKFTAKEARQLAIQLNAGALPVPLKIESQSRVGPTIGADSIEKSLFATAIGLASVAFFMIVYYRILGVFAVSALLIYTLIVFAFFKLIPVTLTLAGIAGFVLSIGMAVDANILIFERIKEELRWGKPKHEALFAGFDRAWSSIRDSNVSSLITCAILFNFGTGAIRGFALTLAIGILISMFSAITVSRTFIRVFWVRKI